jgi:phosphoribosylanthranilate isomerase
MFVKICGITDRAAIDAAVAAGADALGFVFAESVREIAPERARELCEGLPEGTIRVAVMRHPDRERVRRVVETFAPDWIQTDAADFEGIELPPGTLALPVVRDAGLAAAVTRPSAAAPSPQAAAPRPAGAALPPRLLFEGRVSGSGTKADWEEARGLAARTELILAGGLDAGNVAAAIGFVRPFGVDVSSGVEAERGRKDPRKIREFVARVRAMENES